MAPAEKNPGGRKNTRNSGKNIASRVREAVTKPVEDAGYSIWDVTYYKDVSEMVLEIAIDRKADGTPIGTDDCENVTKIVEPILDEMDPIEGSYSLMVSGGGIVRDLRTDEHLDYAIRNGYSVLFRTFTAAAAEDAPSDPKEKTSGGKSGRKGSKQLKGRILSYTDDRIELETESGPKTLDRSQIAKMAAVCDPAGEDILLGGPED